MCFLPPLTDETIKNEDDNKVLRCMCADNDIFSQLQIFYAILFFISCTVDYVSHSSFALMVWH